VARDFEPRNDPFEDEVRDHLRARSAPAGFADRVMARVPAPSSAPRRFWQSAWLPAWRWAAVAAVIAVTVLGGLEHDRQQRIAGERAREQVLLALRITGSTLKDIQQKVSSPDDKHVTTQINAQ
jgi:anti-sigma-K factor RskA